MNPEQTQLIQRAEDSLRAAKLLANNSLPEFAVTRAYYTMFYLAEAFLLGQGLTFSSHSAVISAFGREFARTQRLPVKYHRYLYETFQKRTEADYSLQPNITYEEAQDIISYAEEMLNFTRENLSSI